MTATYMCSNFGGKWDGPPPLAVSLTMCIQSFFILRLYPGLESFVVALMLADPSYPSP